jgi:hypothetical protein
VGLSRGDLAAVVEAIHAVNDGQSAIHGCWCRLGLLVELIANVVDEAGFVDFRQRQRQRRLGPPAGEVQQVKRVGAQRTEGELANALGIEEGVGPSDLLAVLREQAIGRHAGQDGRAIDQK